VAIRSRVLAFAGHTTTANENHVLWTVPAGQTAIVKHWVFVQDSGGTAYVFTGLQHGGTLKWFWVTPAAASGQACGPGLCYLVLEPGDALVYRLANLGSNPGHISSHVSGSLLDGVPT
jgi:hypothetical protein